MDGYEIYESRKKRKGELGAIIDGVAHAGASAAGMYIGGLVGTIFPIPVVGTVLGAVAGSVLGDLFGNVYDFFAG